MKAKGPRVEDHGSTWISFGTELSRSRQMVFTFSVSSGSFWISFLPSSRHAAVSMLLEDASAGQVALVHHSARARGCVACADLLAPHHL